MSSLPKKTCVSINCPFIRYCKDYNFLVERNGGCKTQEAILYGAEKLRKERKKNG